MSSLAALGASAGAVNGMTQDVMAELIDEPRQEVPRVLAHVHTNHEEVKNGASPERAPIFYKIPRSQWRRVESAYDALEQVERQLEGRSEPTNAWVTTNSNGEKRIDVDIYDDGSVGRVGLYDVENAVPSTVDGVAGAGTDMESTVQDIPVNVERVDVEQDTPELEPAVDGMSVDDEAEYYWEDWDELPAGAAMQMYNSIGGGEAEYNGVGTCCTPVDDNGTTKMLTAGHMIDPPNAPESDYATASKPEDTVGLETGQYEYEGSNGNTSIRTFDAGLLEPTGGTDFQYEFATTIGTTRGDISGTVSEDRLRDIEDDGTSRFGTLKRQGAITGSDTRYDITRVGFDGFMTDSGVERGDSGGPFHLELDLPVRLRSTDLTIDSRYESSIQRYYGTTINNIAGTQSGGNSARSVVCSMYRIEDDDDGLGVTV
jgi:hypothetical protein